jgi:hypothetical protein
MKTYYRVFAILSLLVLTACADREAENMAVARR